MATGSGKTVVMGMLIAWQALNKLTKILAGQDKTGVNKESPDQMVRRVCRELGNKRGIVPRVPVADDQMTGEQPTYRELWIHIRDGLPKKGRGTDALVGEPKLPALLEGALAALYGHYEKAYRRWEGNDEAQARGLTPPVFIVVCNNTNVSKLVFDYVAGWERPRPDGSVALVPGKLAIFSNEQSGRWRSHPNTRPDGKIVVEICGVDVYDPTTGEIRSNSTDDIACWFIDTAYNGESFFVRHAYFTGAEDPYVKLKRGLRAEIDEAAWSAIYSTVCRPFEPPKSGRIAVKVINHYGDEVLKTFAV